MILGIDASNIRGGGGVTHLVEFLRTAHPDRYGFRRVVLWSGKSTLKEVPARPWLLISRDALLDRPLPSRLYWQKVRLPRILQSDCELLFAPGGSFHGGFRPFATMSQNLLPFEMSEMIRYGFSYNILRFLLLRLIQTRTFRKADGVIFLTNHAKSSVIKRTGPLTGKVKVIPHGINERFFHPPRTHHQAGGFSKTRPFKALYVSIINFYKHQWHVVEAVAKLRGKGIPIALDLVGPAYPPALKRLRRTIAKFDPDEHFIHYKGQVPHSMISRHYDNADVFVFASTCENMPNIVLEAMAAGLPICCSSRGPMPEILGDAGMYFDPEKPDDISRSIATMFHDRAKREELAWSAYEKAREYTWERCANETFSFLAEIASGAT